ncbi:hypothetical protein CTI14_70500, partial [Methylobacterium radiotolerans]
CQPAGHLDAGHVLLERLQGLVQFEAAFSYMGLELGHLDEEVCQPAGHLDAGHVLLERLQGLVQFEAAFSYMGLE